MALHALHALPAKAEAPSRVVITGGLGVLGNAVMMKFAASGARVAVVDRTDFSLPSPPSDICYLSNIDLTGAGLATQTIKTACMRLGGISVLVNIAGGFAYETVADGSPSTWDQLYASNVKTCVNACRASIPYLRRGGRIINVGAAAANKAAAGMGAYAAAKSGVARLTEALAEELSGQGITVNAVLPGIIDTPQNRAAMPDADPAQWTSPAAIADVIHFLASHEARAINGALVPVTAATGV